MTLSKIMLALALAGAVVGLGQTAAQADDAKVFRVGILGGENQADRLKNWACIQEPLGKALGMEVKLFPAADYDGVIQGLLGGTLDYATLGASGYAKIAITDPKAVEVLGTQQQTDGSTGYYSVLIVRKDSGIAKLEDLKGKALAFADPDSTSGYLVPSFQLTKQLGDLKKFFSKTDFAGGHEGVVLSVLDKKFDAGTTWSSAIGDEAKGYSSGMLTEMVKKGTLNMKDITVLWKSPLIPNGPEVVRTALPADVKAKFKAFLFDLPKTDANCFHAIESGDFKGYVEVAPDFYQSIIDLRKSQIGG